MPIGQILFIFININLNYRVFSIRASLSTFSCWYLFIFASFLFVLAQPFKSCCLLFASRRIRELMHGHFLPLPCTSRIPIVFVVVAVATCPATPAVVFKTFAALKHFYGPCVLVAHDGHGSLRGLAHTRIHSHTNTQS